MKLTLHEIEREHPVLFGQILGKATGILGEIVVTEQLRRIGYEATTLDNNSPQADIAVKAASGERFTIECKTLRKGSGSTWLVRKRPDANASKFWIFVWGLEPGLPDPEQPQFFVFTITEAQQLWDGNPWNQNKRADQSGDFRKHLFPADALGAWHKLSM